MFNGNDEKLVGKVEVKDKMEFRAILHKFHGKEYINFRQFIEKADGNWIPTKTGFTVDQDILPDILDLLAKCKMKGQG